MLIGSRRHSQQTSYEAGWWWWGTPGGTPSSCHLTWFFLAADSSPAATCYDLSLVEMQSIAHP